METKYFLVQLIPDARCVLSGLSDFINDSNMIKAKSLDYGHHHYLEIEAFLPREGLDFVAVKVMIQHAYVCCIFPATVEKRAGFRDSG